MLFFVLRSFYIPVFNSFSVHPSYPLVFFWSNRATNLKNQMFHPGHFYEDRKKKQNFAKTNWFILQISRQLHALILSFPPLYFNIAKWNGQWSLFWYEENYICVLCMHWRKKNPVNVMNEKILELCTCYSCAESDHTHQHEHHISLCQESSTPKYACFSSEKKFQGMGCSADSELSSQDYGCRQASSTSGILNWCIFILLGEMGTTW